MTPETEKIPVLGYVVATALVTLIDTALFYLVANFLTPIPWAVVLGVGWAVWGINGHFVREALRKEKAKRRAEAIFTKGVTRS